MPKQTPAQDEPKTPSLNRIMAQLNKKYEDPVIGRLSEMENVAVERIPSGIPSLDKAVGGGFPKGRMVELYGLQSSGKSLIAQKIMAQAQKEGGEVVYVDLEGTFDPLFAANLGIDTGKLVLMPSTPGEQMFDMLAKILEARPAVIVIDSVAAMVTLMEMEESVEKAEMASKARLMSKGLRKLNALNKSTLIIFINQLRQGISTWGPAPKVTTGGMALPFYASIRIEVKQDKEKLYAESKKEDPIGQIVLFHVSKNKTGAPYKVGNFKFYYEGAKIE